MSYQKRPHPNQQSQPRFRKWMFVVAALVIVAAGAGVWAATRPTKKDIVTGKPAGTFTANADSKGEPAKDSGTTPGTSQNTDSGDKTPGGDTSGTTNANLVAPYGNFISNHKPNLDGSPAPSSEQSVCNTTVGATCQIIFTKDGVTKTLSAQTADGGGATYWEWTLQQVGLTPGTWKVTAKATLGSQTKTTDDVIPFEVGS
jgi:hypothetical protein